MQEITISKEIRELVERVEGGKPICERSVPSHQLQPADRVDGLLGVEDNRPQGACLEHPGSAQRLATPL